MGAEAAYALDPLLIVAARARGERLVAIIHSHCRVGAYFSAEDQRRALCPATQRPLFPGVDYIVLDVQPEGVVGLEIFTWSEARGAFLARGEASTAPLPSPW